MDRLVVIMTHVMTLNKNNLQVRLHHLHRQQDQRHLHQQLQLQLRALWACLQFDVLSKRPALDLWEFLCGWLW